MGRRGIGPDQGKRRRDQQHDAADGFDMEEAFDGGEGALGQQPGARQILPWGEVVHGRENSARRPDRRMNLSRRKSAADTRRPFYMAEIKSKKF
ncbi:hypothetical protein GCM10023144_02620 [Pigmentiphaga soli]|uniref:Uncharacterized protein n=1 Tax=Pigmentiphaga soli TaxID=1007095 RepID=A0ABP8GEI9_9BURK